MGFDKLAAHLNGKPILLHTLQAFLDNPSITDILVICPPARFQIISETGPFQKPVTRIDGGTARHLSVSNGLAAVPADTNLVAIHDAARPLISQQDLNRTIQAAKTHGAASLARRVTETLKRSDSSDFTQSQVSRDHLWFMETPQIFRTDLIQSAYAYILKEGIEVTDETSAIEAHGGRVKLVESTSPNPKITTPSDLATFNPIQ